MSDPSARVGVVTIDAQPAPFDAHAATTAVIVVDVQNDLASVGGMFERAGIDIDVIRATMLTTQLLFGSTATSDSVITAVIAP